MERRRPHRARDWRTQPQAKTAWSHQELEGWESSPEPPKGEWPHWVQTGVSRLPGQVSVDQATLLAARGYTQPPGTQTPPPSCRWLPSQQV